MQKLPSRQKTIILIAAVFFVHVVLGVLTFKAFEADIGFARVPVALAFCAYMWVLSSSSILRSQPLILRLLAAIIASLCLTLMSTVCIVRYLIGP